MKIESVPEVSLEVVEGEFFVVDIPSKGKRIALTQDQVDPCNYGLHDRSFITWTGEGVPHTHTVETGWAARGVCEGSWTPPVATRREALKAAYLRRADEQKRLDAMHDAFIAENPDHDLAKLLRGELGPDSYRPEHARLYPTER